MTLHRPAGGTLRLCAAATVSGLLLCAAFPPIACWPLVFVALAPVAGALRGERPWCWCLAGFIVGLVWHAAVPGGLLGWGLWLSFAAWSAVGAVVAGGFLAAGVLHRQDPSRVRPWALPLALALALHAASALWLPVTLSAALALPAPLLLWPARWVGTVGLDAVIVATSCVLAYALALPAAARIRVLAAIGVALACAGAAVAETRFQRPRPRALAGPLALVQPSVATQLYRVARFSLSARQLIEDRLDRLTAEAAATSAKLIVWPEEGNDLYNRRLPRRQRRTYELGAGMRADWLLASPELTPKGERYNSVFLVRRGRFVARADKTHPVPLIESDYRSGQPAVLDTQLGRAGVAICFDSVFASVMRELARRGADFVLATSNDDSLGAGPLAEWHLAYTSLRAIEAGLPMVFHANRGATVVTDARGGLIERAPARATAGVHYMAAPPPAARSFELPRVLSACAMLAGLLIALGRAWRAAPAGAWAVPAPRRAMAAAASIACAAGIGLLCEVGVAAGFDPACLRDVAQERGERLRPTPVEDLIAPLFRQSDERACGPTALAYALTLLGDRAFPSDLTASIGAISERGVDLAQLARAATQRGFRASGVRTGMTALRRGLRLPLVAHMQDARGEHFVVVVAADADYVHIFDPAIGRTGYVASATFASRWTGYLLSLAPAGS